MYKTISAFIITVLLPVKLFSQPSITGTWGDQGNGTYINPVLNADYSDPDVIRVGENFYMVCSEFHYMGIPVLHSKDLVNWEIIGHVYDRFLFHERFSKNEGYGRGSWAPALRFHDGKYWIYFCTPDDGLFMSNAEKPEGPWNPLVQVAAVAGWEDPCPFWDEDGKAYMGHSKTGAGPIIIHKMSFDGTKLLDDGATVYTGFVAEGTKIYKLNNYYYLSIPEGGVTKGWQTILRSRNIYGPYEKKVVLETGSTGVNGPHQGALVDLPNGDWWFMHFQDRGAIGRVCHLQPVRWIDNWPVIGVDIDFNGIGEPVYVWRKPSVVKNYPITAPQTSDEFNATVLGLQWAWNHNPVDSSWSLKDKHGYFTIKALKAESFLKASNTITQKLMGDTGDASVEMDVTKMADGQKSGLCHLGKQYNLIGVQKKNGMLSLFLNINGKVAAEIPLKQNRVYLRTHISLVDNKNSFYYSLDNKKYLSIGDSFPVQNGFWKGDKIGLFSYNEIMNEGIASFNWFHYDYDGPKNNK